MSIVATQRREGDDAQVDFFNNLLDAIKKALVRWL
jgi:hypothetical protein